MWTALGSGVALGQNDFKFTEVVDPDGDPYHSTIQAAIDAVPNNTSDRYTVLIYAGTYAESITLDGTQENIDLVGIDRDAVIIAPSTAGNGITITSGGETTRNNAIRNLTIRPFSGHGIEIVKGGTPIPDGITIDGVTIEADGSTKNGVRTGDVKNLTINNCDISSDDAGGVFVNGTTGIGAFHNSDHVVILGTKVRAPANGVHAVDLSRVNDVTIGSCDFKGETDGLHLFVFGLEVTGSRIEGGSFGVEAVGDSKFMRFAGSQIIAAGATADAGVRYDPTVGGIILENGMVFQSCAIESHNSSSNAKGAIWADGGIITAIDCDIIAESTDDEIARRVRGVLSFASPAVIIGGSITTSSSFERSTEVYDLDSSQAGSAGGIFISNVAFSKWKGPIQSADRAQSVLQRMVNVAAADADDILNDQDLDGSDPTLDFTLGHYRTLQLTWNSASGADIEVTVKGKDWAGATISEDFTLTTSAPVANGSKPFKFVEKVFLPTASGSLDMGWNNKLGLYYPLAAGADVLQWSKLVLSEYQIQTIGNLTVDADFATVKPNTIAANDDFGFLILTPN